MQPVEAHIFDHQSWDLLCFPAEPRHRAGPLPERAVTRGFWEMQSFAVHGVGPP